MSPRNAPVWARIWAHGPSRRPPGTPYRPRATASDREEPHERPAAEDRRRGQGPGERLDRNDHHRDTPPRPRPRTGGDKGQTAVEYLGIIAVVVAIVVLIANTNLGQTIVDKLTTQIGKVAP